MQLHTFLSAIPLFTMAALLGCSGPPSTAATDSLETAASQATADENGVVKIAVLADGTVYVNEETVPIDALGSKLDEIGQIKEFWYHRQSPTQAEPHENAMKVIAELANRRLPIAMYVDRKFTQRANLGP